MKEKFVGPGQILNPPRIARVYVSPSKRARQTYDLLQFPLSSIAKVIYTDDILEWDYGHYEGLKKDDIKTLRKQRGLDLEREWDLWRDGCEGGEYDLPLLSCFHLFCGLILTLLRSVEDITKRLDRIISEVRSFQGDCMDGHGPGDVLVVCPLLSCPDPIRKLSLTFPLIALSF